MCKNVGIKHHKSKRNNTGRIAKPFASSQKYKKAQSERKQLRTRPHLEDELVSVSVIMGKPITAIQIRFSFEKSMQRRWNPQRFRKDWHGREKLH